MSTLYIFENVDSKNRKVILIRKNPVKNFRSQKKNTKKMTLVRILDEFAKRHLPRGPGNHTCRFTPVCVSVYLSL